MSIIKPTIGRRVWFWPNGSSFGITNDAAQPCDAGICYVWSDRMVNLTVADHNGQMHARTSVELVQEGDSIPSSGAYATWMPYQQGQAKKHEAEASEQPS